MAEKALDGWEPVEPDEIVYRRVTKDKYNPKTKYLPAKGFKPREIDTDGISLCRANYLPEPKPEAAAALGLEGMEFWVIELRAGDLADKEMEVVPSPTQQFIGHASIPVLNAANRDNEMTMGLMDAASKLAIRVHGPFPGKLPRSPANLP